MKIKNFKSSVSPILFFAFVFGYSPVNKQNPNKCFTIFHQVYYGIPILFYAFSFCVICIHLKDYNQPDKPKYYSEIGVNFCSLIEYLVKILLIISHLVNNEKLLSFYTIVDAVDNTLKKFNQSVNFKTRFNGYLVIISVCLISQIFFNTLETVFTEDEWADFSFIGISIMFAFETFGFMIQMVYFMSNISEVTVRYWSLNRILTR